MAPILAPTPTAPPGDPVRTAPADPATESALRTQALSRLNKWRSDLPLARRDQEAAAIVEKTQLRALEKSEAFDPSRGDVGAWLHGLLTNVLCEHCRELNKLPAQPPADHENWDGLDQRLTQPNTEEVELLLERLNPDERNLVEWAYFDQLTFRQIGERLKIREGTARQRVHRVLAKLKRESHSERREGSR